MYCTFADLLDQIPEADLAELTDDREPDDPDAGTVALLPIESAMDDAASEIDSYAGKRYSVPLSPVPAIIRRYARDIAIYNLHQRRPPVPNDWQQRYDAALEFLLMVSRGDVMLGTQGGPSARFGSAVRRFSRSSMEGF